MKDYLNYLVFATISIFMALVLLVIQVARRSFGVVFWLSVGLCVIGIGLFALGISIVSTMIKRKAEEQPKEPVLKEEKEEEKNV